MSAEQTQDAYVAMVRQKERNRANLELAAMASETQNQQAAVAQVLRENALEAQQRQLEILETYEAEIAVKEKHLESAKSKRVKDLLSKQIDDLIAKCEAIINGKDEVALLTAQRKRSQPRDESGKFAALEASR